MNSTPHVLPSHDLPLHLMELLDRVQSLAHPHQRLPDPSTAEGQAVRTLLTNNWLAARDGLLARTERIRVRPETAEAPLRFFFEIDRPYRRKRPGGGVELDPGPVVGEILYHPRILQPAPGQRCALVFVRSPGFYHPNYSRALGVLCLGDLPPGAFPLDVLLEHLYSIVSYQNYDAVNALDPEASDFFCVDPHALDGLRDVLPLYG